MTDRRRRGPRPSKADAALADRIRTLETRVEELRAEVARNKEAFLRALASIPGARGSLPPPKS